MEKGEYTEMRYRKKNSWDPNARACHLPTVLRKCSLRGKKKNLDVDRPHVRVKV